jgi:hypothetical protein
MVKIEIKNSNNVVTNFTEFNSEAEALNWYNSINDSGGFIVPHTKTITDITAQRQAEQESVEAKQYLDSTDWLVVRKAETGQDYLQEIKDLRAAARLKVL